MRVQFEQAKVLQDYQNFALILAAAFGGGKAEKRLTKEEAKAQSKKLSGSVFSALMAQAKAASIEAQGADNGERE